MAMNLDNARTAKQQPKQPQRASDGNVAPTSSAIAPVNNFALAGTTKAKLQKAELVEVARTAYREEMATLGDDIAAMLQEEDGALDVPDFFGLSELPFFNSPPLPQEDPQEDAAALTVDVVAGSTASQSA